MCTAADSEFSDVSGCFFFYDTSHPVFDAGHFVAGRYYAVVSSLRGLVAEQFLAETSLFGQSSCSDAPATFYHVTFNFRAAVPERKIES